MIILSIWGWIGGRLFEVTHYSVEMPKLPDSWEGEKIALISDLQIGMWGENLGVIEQAVNKILAVGPAAVLITGDFIYHTGGSLSKDLETAQTLLRPLAATGIPIFAVLGNHDYGLSSPKNEINFRFAQAVTKTLQQIGIDVLKNEAARIRLKPEGQTLSIAGIGPHWPGYDNVAEALKALPDSNARIFFMHNPDSFTKIPSGEAPLALAGHTHGGQVRLPFTPEYSWLHFIKSDELHADGWIENFGNPGNRLYVNRGIGFSILPLRINAEPELTIFTLQKTK